MPVCPCLAVADIFAAWCLRTQGKVRMAVIYEPGTSALPAEAEAAARAAPACSCSHASRQPCQVAWPVDGSTGLSLAAARVTGGTGGTEPLAAPLEMAADFFRNGRVLTFVSRDRLRM
jgi:hypothetical protein